MSQSPQNETEIVGEVVRTLDDAQRKKEKEDMRKALRFSRESYRRECEQRAGEPEGVTGDYEVETILNYRPVYKDGEIINIEFLIKWQGYPEEESTWEGIEHCLQCLELIRVVLSERFNFTFFLDVVIRWEKLVVFANDKIIKNCL